MNRFEEDVESLKLTQNSNSGQGKYERVFTLGDITNILDDCSNDDDHEKILDWIEEKNLCLYSKEKDSGDSLIKILLEEVGNGHEVVKKVMDSYISTTCSNPNSNAFNIKMDFTGLMLETEKENIKKSGDSVLDDIVELKLKYQEYFWNYYAMKEQKGKFLGKQINSSTRNHLTIYFSGLLAHPISKKEKKRSCLGKQVNS